jgi:hypothetical protein
MSELQFKPQAVYEREMEQYCRDLRQYGIAIREYTHRDPREAGASPPLPIRPSEFIVPEGYEDPYYVSPSGGIWSSAALPF